MTEPPTSNTSPGGSFEFRPPPEPAEIPKRVYAERAPIIGLALCAVVAAYAGLVTPLLWPVFGAAIILALAYRLSPEVRRRFGADAPVYLLFSLAMFSHAWLSERPRSPEHLLHQVPEEEYLSLVGVVSAEPALFPSIDGTTTNTFVPVKVESIGRYQVPQPARGAVQLAFYDQTPNLAYGDRVRVDGTVFRRDGPGPLLSRTRHKCRVHTHEIIDRDQGTALLAASYRLRQSAARILGLGLDDAPDERGVLRAMILGYRQELPRDWSKRFARTGTLHVFAISGLHVGILAAVVFFFLKWIGVSRMKVFYILFPIIVVFVVTTGLKASAIRAAIMLGLYWLAPAIRRPSDSRAALAMAALVILAVAPHQIRSIGFLFSFIIVAGIIALYPILYAPLRRFGLPDPWELSERTLRMRSRKLAASHLGGLVAMSTAAWLVSMPLTAYFFNLFSPGALLGNLIVVPAATWIVWTGLCTLVLGIFSDTAAAFGNDINRVIVSGLLGLIGLLDRLPFSHRFVQSPPLLLVLLYYGTLFCLVIRKLRTRWTTLILAGLVFGFGAWTAWQARLPRLDVLPFERGQAELLLLPGADVLFDTGPAHRSFELREHLKGNGVNRLSALILTHADASHIAGAPELLASWPVDELWLPDTPRSSPTLERLLMTATNMPIKRVAAGDQGTFGKGKSAIDWTCLHPPRGFAPDRADDHSLVLRLSDKGGRSVILSGGLGSEREATLTSLTPPPSDLLILGDNTDPEIGTPAWLKSVEPSHVIIPFRTWERDGNPNHALIERIEKSGATSINMHKTGPVRFHFRNGTLEALSESGSKPGRKKLNIK